jgi:hypothetical protein
MEEEKTVREMKKEKTVRVQMEEVKKEDLILWKE